MIAGTVVRNQIMTHNAQIAALSSKDISSNVQKSISTLQLLIYQLETSQESLLLQARAIYELRLRSPLTYRALYLFDNDGNMMLHLEETLSELVGLTDISLIVDRESVMITDEMRTALTSILETDTYISRPYLEGIDRVPVIIVGIPVISKIGENKQYILAKIDLRDIWRKIDEISIGQTGRAYLVSLTTGNNSMILAHPERSYVGLKCPVEVSGVLDGYQDSLLYPDSVSGKTMIASYTPITTPRDWGIVVEQSREEALRPMQTIFLLTVIILLIAIGLTFYIMTHNARSVAEPITRLEAATRKISETGNLNQHIHIKGHDEASLLAETFNDMAQKLSKSFRTIEQQKADLEKYRDHLELMVEYKTHELQEKNRKIMDSIIYASMIQAAILPSRDQFPDDLKNDIFVLWKPRDIVGGDFYWYRQLGIKHIFALGDCTGHGVPGALMTMSVTSALSSIIEEKNDFDTSVLNTLNSRIIKMVQGKSGAGVQDAGLDIGVLVLEHKNQTIKFSGASMDLFVTGSDGIKQYRGNKHSLGYKKHVVDTCYENQSIYVPKGELAVLTSDGFIHQIGGKKNISYGRKRFMNLIGENRDKSTEEIKTIFENEIENYRGLNPQLDDITVVGFRI
jgi:serine phosphatase RsbU (regulator of sigma subunit)